MDSSAWTSGGAEPSLNFRNPTLTLDGGISSYSRTPYGQVRTASAPPLPPRPYHQSAFGGSSFGGYGNSPWSGGYGASSYGYGSPWSSGGFGSMYGGGFGSMYGGGFGRGFGAHEAENRFIQIAEESSRGTFQSIESVVNAVGGIAAMLDSTFFALTSSFRAVLGVAANFGRLRGLFAQFWQSFTLFRTLNWIYRKLLYWLRITKTNPAKMAVNEAWGAASGAAEAAAAGSGSTGSSSMAVIAFLGFIMIGPYLLMKLLGTVSNTALEESKNPKTWTRPLQVIAQFDFQATQPGELNLSAGQEVLVAPKDVQNMHKLLTTGWVLATVDNQTSGLIPVNYIESAQKLAQQPPPQPPEIPKSQPEAPPQQPVDFLEAE